MDHDDSRQLLKNILAHLVQKPRERAASLSSQRDEAWMRVKAYMQHESLDSDDIPIQDISRALGTLESAFEFEPYSELEANKHHIPLYPKLEATLRDGTQNRPNQLDSTISNGKRKRGNEAIMGELSRLETEAKKRRVVPRQEPPPPRTFDNNGSDDEPEVDFAILTRKHSISLHQGLLAQWNCICTNCSGLSVRLSLPQRTKSSHDETCFDVFFGVRSILTASNTLQEATITVKDLHNESVAATRTTTQFDRHALPEIAYICNCITDSLQHRNCLHLLFEDGMFKRLRPKPKNFGDNQISQTVSLSAFFKRQQELQGSLSVLPLKGKRILAVTLATALLPFLETPWVQPSFNHSNIQFFRPLQNGELPDITKPFLDMEQAPLISGSKPDNRRRHTEPSSFNHMVHPNASVLALGILLCELHDCTPVGSLQKDTTAAASDINANYYTSLDKLKDLEVDAGVDYYLATKACLQWEYFPAGEPTSFESTSVQRLFYQNVIKRLESEIFKLWCLRSEDLASLDSRQNELCWGSLGQQVLRQSTTTTLESLANNKTDQAVSPPGPPLPVSTKASSSSILPNSAVLQMQTGHNHGLQTSEPHLAEHLRKKSLYLFDATHQTVSESGARLSREWMDRLFYSINHAVDIQNYPTTSFKPVKIAILDSGFDPRHPNLIDNQQLDPRIKGAQSFVHGTSQFDILDEIGHGTHALGLLLSVAPCAEIYIARVATQETLGQQSYDAITKAINHAVTVWDVDIISMSFGIREYNEPMTKAMSLALHNGKLMFAAASNDGANFGRAFPAKYPGVFCIHSTDGEGNPSSFNPTADEKDVNFSILGEHVSSHWSAGRNGHNDYTKAMSGTSVATPIAAGLAAMIMSFVRQQEQDLAKDSDLLGQWLKDAHAMDLVLKSMVRRRGVGYDYITPHTLLDVNSSRQDIYNKIRDIKTRMFL